ncbi:hypothetical protein [Halorientalis halophila]|uniref:hypothetical protein n=1 Tax=Halorientalis halophila TaxID=3108499 RepID=UPI00300853EF
MGKVSSRDPADEWEVTTPEWNGDVEVQLRDDEIAVVVPDDAPYTSDDVVITDGREHDETLFPADAAWPLVVPSVAGLVALAADWLDPLAGFGTAGWVLTVGLYWLYTLVGVLGTLALYERASAAPDEGLASNPWPYIVGGGLGFTAIQVLLRDLPATWQAVAGSLAGAFLFGCVVAASITGPLYLFVSARTSAPAAT